MTQDEREAVRLGGNLLDFVVRAGIYPNSVLEILEQEVGNFVKQCDDEPEDAAFFRQAIDFIRRKAHD